MNIDPYARTTWVYETHENCRLLKKDFLETQFKNAFDEIWAPFYAPEHYDFNRKIIEHLVRCFPSIRVRDTFDAARPKRAASATLSFEMMHKDEKAELNNWIDRGGLV